MTTEEFQIEVLNRMDTQINMLCVICVAIVAFMLYMVFHFMTRR